MIQKNFIPILSLSLGMLLMGSCQKEEKQFIDDTNNPQTISANSQLTQLLISASQNDGTQDNLIDGSSCLKVVFPITVEANSQTVTLNSLNDVAQVQAIFDQSSTDVDQLVIQFPITVGFEDFSTLTVSSQTELNAIATSCENTIDDAFACVEFLYPISCYIYNSSNEQTGFVTLGDDYEWFDYLNYLETNIYIAIDFPMGVVVNGQTIQAATNQELLNAITQADCSQSISTSGFEDVLSSGTWYVNLFMDSDDDETCNFEAYAFQFNNNGTVTATSISDTRNGTWSTSTSGDDIDVFFNFELQSTNDPFEDLNDDDWHLLGYNTESIHLEDLSGGNGGTDTLLFGRDPYTDCGGGGGGGQDLIDKLLNGPWYVATYLDDGNDETSDYSNFSITFNAIGTVVATHAQYTYTGTWEVVGTSDLDLVLDFGTQAPFDEFNDDWDVLSYTANTINLEDVSGGGGGTDTLVLQKL
ncbi:MAG TPA: hypothetical protein PKW08_02965 [Flavobacteriaceae bacterium]|nr:hypothetical protein [Flavobacteriaceae bacterium]MCB9212963.1 hypothetical protein [Alteromonas sp.]HPF11365.1 hypothetical protein [Flavobacteriaceae bacterium]HQU20528.1 hypothetical protein [Flavobacteriaceae bacterium]HQU65839.1 hypothetical protein [Flavobacteriaceae bacterium]